MHKFLVGNSFMAKLILGEMTFETGLLDIATTQVTEFKKRLDRAEDGPCTFTERLLMNQKANPKSITDRELITHALGNITAGGDTTSITLRSMFYFALRNNASYQRLCEEVRSNCTFPATFASARDLPYLNAVIKEALRLHPPMAIMLARTVPKGGAEICGHFVPEGTECGISAYVLHRDRSVFPDPEAWKPERWLTTDTEHLNLMNRADVSIHRLHHGGVHFHFSGRDLSLIQCHGIP